MTVTAAAPSEAVAPPEHRPAYPPVAVFASVMGVAGLGLAWRIAATAFGWPAVIGEAMLAAGALLFVGLSLVYASKAVRAPSLVVAEYRDAATSSYFGTIVISISLLAVAAIPYSRGLATVLWLIGVIAGAALLVALLGSWIVDRVPTAKVTPAWFIPVVGNAATAYAGVGLGYPQVAWASFAFAVLCWLTLQPLIFYRLLFAEPLPPRAAPSLAVLVSSPAVLGSAWFLLTGGTGGPVFSILTFKAVFMALLVGRLWKMARGMVFSVAAWGYTFPAAALASVLLRYYLSAPSAASAVLADVALAIATLVVAVVSVLSLRAIVRDATVARAAA